MSWIGLTSFKSETNNLQTQLLADNISNNSSNLSSLDSLSETNNVQNMKHDLKELEEKLHKVNIFRAQLKKEKADLIYQVYFLRDLNEEIEEQTLQLQRDQKKASEQSKLEKEDCYKLQDDLDAVRSQLSELVKLVEEKGLVVIEHDWFSSNKNSEESHHRRKKDLVFTEVVKAPQQGRSFDTQVKELVRGNYELREELSRLKQELEEVKAESCNQLLNVIEDEGNQQSISMILVEKSASPIFV